MQEFYPASNDVMFKALFLKHPKLLRAFLRDVLELPLTDKDRVDLLNQELVPEAPDGKMGRLDIHVEMGNKKFNVEMQARSKGFSADRVLYYWAEMYTTGVRPGQRYENIEQTFSVNILGFRYLECEAFHSSFSVREDERNERLTDKLSVHIFELPKVKDIKGDKKKEWMWLIKAGDEEALKMLKDNTESPEIKEAADAVSELNADIALRERIRARHKAVMDYGNDIATAKDEGREEGIQVGLQQGREEGILETYVSLVREGILTPDMGAQRCGMTLDAFKQLLREH